MKRGSALNRFMDRYVGIPAILTTAVFNRKRERPAHLKRIGIMSSPTLGDTLLTSAALKDLGREFPSSRIIFFTSPGNRVAAQLLPCVDEVIEIPLTSPWLAIREMRAKELDVLFDFTQWQRLTAFYTAFSGARFRVGFRTANQHRHWHYDATAEHSNSRHELENFRSLLGTLGVRAIAEPELSFKSSGDDSRHGLYRRIVFHPWASGHRGYLREWPLDRWLELANRLKSPDTIFSITGGPADEPRCREFEQAFRAAGLHPEIVIGSDGLNSIVQLLRRSELVVSVNTGIMHLAAIAGAPTIALNGPTATHRWGPVGPRVAAVEPRGGGGGFLHFGFEFKGNPTDTMERIAVDDVVAAARKLTVPVATGRATASIS